MKVTDIAVIFLFVLPGLFAEKISHLVDIPSDKKTTEFKETINGILLSVPILLISFAITYYCHKFQNISEIISMFSGVTFLFKFITLVIATTICIGLLKGLFQDGFYFVLNKVRTKFLSRISINNKSCWSKLFLDDNNQRFVKITKDGRTFSGLTKHYSLPGEEKEIVIYTPEEWRYFPKIEDTFKEVNNVYINIEKNIVIEDYDMTEYNKFCDNEQCKQSKEKP